MGIVLTIANRKGGVGKTTLALALAETFVYEHKFKTLVIDLDPQSSASEAMLSADHYADRVERSRTLANLLDLDSTITAKELDHFLVGGRHSLLSRGYVDLAVLPNSPEHWDFEITKIRKNEDESLRKKVREIIRAASSFDMIIIDSPPGKMIAAEEALLSSSVVLCPVVPERLSVWGMDRMTEYFEELRQQGKQVPPWRFVVSKYVSNARETEEQMRNIEAKYGKHFISEKPSGLNLLGQQPHSKPVIIPQKQIIVQKIAKMRDNPDEVKSLEGFYGADVADALRKVAKHVKRDAA